MQNSQPQDYTQKYDIVGIVKYFHAYIDQKLRKSAASRKTPELITERCFFILERPVCVHASAQ